MAVENMAMAAEVPTTALWLSKKLLKATLSTGRDVQDKDLRIAAQSLSWLRGRRESTVLSRGYYQRRQRTTRRVRS